MANKMLIDATHREETRVVVCKGSRVEEFDLESQERRQLKGNIYLAKVTRVEPSLQAAFVDYGGNRHGFLAFSEIHPDYYQIPYSDRQELLKEAAEAGAIAEDAETGEPDEWADAGDGGEPAAEPGDGETAASAEDGGDDGAGDDGAAEAGAADAVSGAAAEPEPEEAADPGPGRRPRRRRRGVAARATVPAVREDADDDDSGRGGGEEIENVGAEDALEELPDRQLSRRRQYKIQEVIRRRQILLVQVVKEERGTKGAALTTYLSLAGRYCVLMPNTARGGGISRKITSAADRKRLKSIAGDLTVPEGTGVIVRTAGANRTKAEIKRDFEYLQRLWETIRTLTLKSTAPSLIYEEGSLIKRSIRDLYNKDVDEVLVAGDEGYREAKAFMRMLMPSHARHVKQYKEDQPLFVRHRVESQLSDMFVPEVTLKSGGYLVINQTEALVAIDVNSGRATREHNVEDTALQTNLEAAAEVARQLRLRDLAGLIVIDFIDMEERRNNRAVERRLKDCLKTDRARIQVGRISHFGLLEMSRQRIRASVIEGTMQLCRHCEGSGRTRSVSSTALQILRNLEEMVADGKRHNLAVSSGSEIALYMMNRKRAHIGEIEARYGIEITIQIDDTLAGSAFTIARGAVSELPLSRVTQTAVQIDAAFEEADEEADEKAEIEATEIEATEAGEDGAEAAGAGRRRRRRRRRRPEDTAAGDAGDGAVRAEPAEFAQAAGPAGAALFEGEAGGEADDDGHARPKRRRGRRGGRRQRREDGVATAQAREGAPDRAGDVGGEIPPAGEQDEAGAAPVPAGVPDAGLEAADGVGDEPGPAPGLRPAIPWPWRGAGVAAGEEPEFAGDEPEPAAPSNGAAAGSAPASDIASAAATQAAGEPAPQAEDAPAASEERAADDEAGAPSGGAEGEPDGPQRRGWWQRRFANSG
jgi:ribonuclease E